MLPVLMIQFTLAAKVCVGTINFLFLIPLAIKTVSNPVPHEVVATALFTLNWLLTVSSNSFTYFPYINPPESNISEYLSKISFFVSSGIQGLAL